MKRIVIALFALMLLVGCGGNSAGANRDFSSGIKPNILECGSSGADGGGSYYYIVDMNTGVVYLSYDGYRRHAISVMLNADGSPVTAEQLGIDYKWEQE